MNNVFKAFISNIKEKGFFHLLSANALIQVVSFASYLFVAHLLTPDDIGRIKFIQVLTSIFSIIGGMGFGLSILKICSEQRPYAYKKIIFNAAFLFTLLSTLCSYLLIVAMIRCKGLLTTDQTTISIAPFAFLPIILGTLFAQIVAYLQALKKIKILSALTTTNKVLTIILILIFSYFYGLKGYFWALNLGLLLILLHSFQKIRTDIQPSNINFKKQAKLFSIHWQYARPALFSNLLSDTTSFIDIILINFLFSNLTEIGYYSFALTLIVALRIVPATVQQISNPYFSENGTNKSIVHQHFVRYGKLLLLIIILSFIAFLVIVPLSIQTFFSSYTPSIPYLIPLAIAWSIRQYNKIIAAALFGMGKINYIAYTQLISLIINIIVIPLSLKQWGLVGVSWSLIPCFCLNVLVMYLFYKKAIHSK